MEKITMNPKYHKAIVGALKLAARELKDSASMSKLLMEHHYACTTDPGELTITAKVEFNIADQIALQQRHPHEAESFVEGEIVFSVIPKEAEPDVGYFERYVDIDQLKYFRYFDEDTNPEESFGIWSQVPSTCMGTRLSCENKMIQAALDELNEADKEIYDEPMERY
jgi:hypothetical protein